MVSSPSSTYGTKLNPSKFVVTEHGFKGERQVITFSQNSSSIASQSGQTLLIRFPTLEKDRVVAPATVRLLFDVKLTSTNVNCKFATNLGRAIIEKLTFIFALMLMICYIYCCQ